MKRQLLSAAGAAAITAAVAAISVLSDPTSRRKLRFIIGMRLYHFAECMEPAVGEIPRALAELHFKTMRDVQWN